MQSMIPRVDGLNQKWAGEISYIWTSEGWLYPLCENGAVILDLYLAALSAGPPLGIMLCMTLLGNGQ